MALANYDALVTQIRIDANRNSSVLTDEVIQQRVAEAEAKILRRLRVHTMEQVAELSASGAELSIPAGFKSSIDMFVQLPDADTGDDGEPSGVDFESFQRHLRRTWGSTGRPRIVAEYENDAGDAVYHIWPTPDSPDYVFSLRYLTKIDGLGPSTQTTPMFLATSDAFLYGSMAGIHMFLQDFENQAVAQSHFESIMVDLVDEQDERELTGSTQIVSAGYPSTPANGSYGDYW